MQEYNGMKVGDLITTYNKGIFRLTGIERRIVTKDIHDKCPTAYPVVGDDYNPLFNYVPVCDSKGGPVKNKKEIQCDSYFCRPASVYLAAQKKIVEDLEKIIANV